MAAENWRTSSSLIEELINHPYRFEFFRAVRLLIQSFPNRQPVGYMSIPDQEVVRFQTHLSLAFPPSAMCQIQEGDDRTPLEMTVAFMGLFGAEGTLPRHYTELLMQRAQQNDHAFRRFLDLLNHRFISLFYRAWEKHRCIVGYEQSIVIGKRDRFADILFAFIGLRTASVRDRFGEDRAVLLRYAGLLAKRPRSAYALKQCLSDLLGVPVAIHQFIGAWLKIEDDDLTRIGVAGMNNLLGSSTVLGSTVWDQQAGFRVQVGPMDFQTHARLLPSGSVYPTLNRLINFIAGPEFDFDVRLVLKASDVPFCVLDTTETYAPRLGWTTWLTTTSRRQDAEDVVFSSSLGSKRAA